MGNQSVTKNQTGSVSALATMAAPGLRQSEQFASLAGFLLKAREAVLFVRKNHLAFRVADARMRFGRVIPARQTGAIGTKSAGNRKGGTPAPAE